MKITSLVQLQVCDKRQDLAKDSLTRKLYISGGEPDFRSEESNPCRFFYPGQVMLFL